MWSKQNLVDTLRRTGFPELADEALRELPDPVDEDQLEAWTTRHGLTRGDVIDRMGGSP